MNKMFAAIPLSCIDPELKGDNLEQLKSQAWHKAYSTRQDYILVEITHSVDVRPKVLITEYED